MLLIRLSTAVREDSSAFCLPFYGHSKPKNPTEIRVPAVGNDGNRVVRDGSSVEAAARILAATFSGGAARGHTASDVVS